jgi:hypothetical protein
MKGTRGHARPNLGLLWVSKKQNLGCHLDLNTLNTI